MKNSKTAQSKGREKIIFVFDERTDKNAIMNLQDIQNKARESLRAAQVEQPAREARWLIKHALAVSAKSDAVSDADLISGERVVTADEAAAVAALVARRAAGEPVSRIIGDKDFAGLSFRVTPDVLDPRPDTETLVAAAQARFAGQEGPRRILDLGTGSGCILIALLHTFPESTGVGVDISQEALAVAAENAQQLGVADRATFMQGDWAESVNESFDLIVSNPPYIPSGDIPNLDKEVKNHDPILALDGGLDGLDSYKKIFSQIKNIFLPGGGGLFEVGVLQAQDVARLAGNAGFLVKGYHADSAGILRVVEIDSGEK